MWEHEGSFLDELDQYDQQKEILHNMQQELTKELKIANAEKGDVSAFADVALSYYYGFDAFEKDWQKAGYYAQKAMEKGENTGDFVYGLILLNTTDKKTGLGYIRKAADEGNIMACLEMGRLYFEGNIKGFFPRKKMVHYYRKAAETASAEAQYMLAYCYCHGDGVRQNIEQFEFWLCCAYLNQLPQAREVLQAELAEGAFGGEIGVRRKLEQIKTQYPQYLSPLL